MSLRGAAGNVPGGDAAIACYTGRPCFRAVATLRSRFYYSCLLTLAVLFLPANPYLRNVIKVTCAIIVDANGVVFAAQRSATMSLPLKWEFPGGKIEPGETAEACLIREIKEELHVDVEIVAPLPANTHQYPNITVQLIPFVCKITTGEILLKEHLHFKWLSKDELLALDWAEADVPIVKYYLEN